MRGKLTPFAAGLLASSFMVAPAFAQDADEADEINDNVIIVTATKRAQDVQEIPLAVTAVSPAQLEAQGVVNVQDIGSVASSFSSSQAQNSNGTVVLRIRGIGTTSNNIGFESAVGIFVDGAYQSRPGVALSEFVDVERVEVLRGPQGTLFGRNTSAGALNITNKRPELGVFGGFANATYGNYDHMSVQAGINVPLAGDTVAARVSGAYRKRDGFVTVLDKNGNFLEDSNNVDQFLVRGQIGWETDSGFRGRIVGDYSKADGSCCAAVEVYRSPIEGTPLFSLVGLGARGGMAHEVPATTPFDNRAAQAAVDRRTATASRLHPSSSKQWGVVAEMEYPLGDNADVIYIGSYRQYDNQESYDSAFSGLDLFNVLPGGGTEIDTMTHELRVQGEAMDGRLNWMIGGYYSDEDITQEVNFGLGADYPAFAAALFAAGTASATRPAGLFYAAAANGLTGLNPADPLRYLSGGANAAVSTSTVLYEQKSKSWSVFTNNTFEITDGLEFTVGLRYSDESKDGRFDQLASNNPACLGFLSPTSSTNPNPAGLTRLGAVAAAAGVPTAAIPATVSALAGTSFVLSCFPFVAPAIGTNAIPFPLPREFDDTFSDKELIYTGKIGYDFGDVNAYASFTHGFKSGGFNLDITAAAGGADPRFASEEVDAYEVGVKGRFLDDAVTANLALFYQEFANFQVLEFTGSQFTTFNVPKAISKGFELESQIRPDRRVTVDLGLTYADAYYPDDCAPDTALLTVRNLCGAQHTNAPKLVTIMGATFRDDIGSDLSFFLNGQVRAESDRRTSTQPRVVPTTAAALGTTALLPFDVQDGNVKINLRAGIGDADDAWGIEAWVTNLTNEVTRGITFSTTLRSGSRSAFTQEPRMYGVTLRGKF
ncbi:TonB-dependent receptor [Altererythrobacter sp. BO-6]|uniref:TonB-dependent receptor n=1 Tax=Altererythrobacter sp. BO-6 TaxID=2604537 RepID=UPI0013E15A4A|nr:TonB-dependent receptor [Altererythrobacter sp. BO-6]QIG54523.1 TonB-dependent receptor [Altererythrobacter sp. BO-6]